MASVAIVDIGSASVRMLLDGRYYTAVTRLGEGLKGGTGGKGRLTRAALDRTDEALAGFGKIISDAGASRVIPLATAAARNASNTHDLFDIARKHLGASPKLLTGRHEGELAFAGAARASGRSGPILVVDIGGASTEFAAGFSDSGLSAVYSADIGAASVTESFLSQDPPSPAELSAALSVVELHLIDAAREIPDFTTFVSGGHVVVIGGTVTTMAAVEIGLEPFDPARVEGFVLTSAAAEDVFRTLATEALEDRVANPGLGPDRAPIIVGGACIVVEMMRQFGLGSIQVSNAGLIEGVAAAVGDGSWDG